MALYASAPFLMRTSFNSPKGFTLIELLIVIAIIGILSAVVLVSLNSARGKGTEAAQKKDIIAMRSQANLYVDANGHSFAGLCSASNTVVNGTKNVYDMVVAYAAKYDYEYSVANNAAGNMDRIVCHANDNGRDWAIQTPLKTGSNSVGNYKFFCVDYLGQALTVTSTRIGGTAQGDFSCQ